MNADKSPITQYTYFQKAGQEFRAVDSDVYYEDDKGRKFKRFYQGQEIPVDIWEVHFGKAPVEDEAEPKAPESEEEPKEPEAEEILPPAEVSEEEDQPKTRKTKNKK